MLQEPAAITIRPYMAGLARFLTTARVEEILLGEHPYGYALNNPVTFSDPSGLFPTPNCSEISDCLKKTPKCGGKKPISIPMMLCVFWQETNFGFFDPPGGMGSCTKACFDTLVEHGCFKQFKSYKEFTEKATKCEKAQAAYAFIQIVGLDRYGPGKGRPGDYRGPTGDKIRACEQCITHDVPDQCRHYFGGPPPPLDEICGYCFVTKVHK